MSKKKIDDKIAMEMYENGCSDREIADKFSATAPCVCLWRRQRGLQSNYPCKKVNHVKFMKLYSAGMSDSDIGDLLGHYSTVICWHRRYYGLPANRVNFDKKQTCENATSYEQTHLNGPESLYCDGDFLEKLTGKQIKIGDECNKDGEDK